MIQSQQDQLFSQLFQKTLDVYQAEFVESNVSLNENRQKDLTSLRLIAASGLPKPMIIHRLAHYLKHDFRHHPLVYFGRKTSRLYTLMQALITCEQHDTEVEKLKEKNLSLEKTTANHQQELDRILEMHKTHVESISRHYQGHLLKCHDKIKLLTDECGELKKSLAPSAPNLTHSLPTTLANISLWDGHVQT